jgi:hypothetical protein
MGASKLDGLDRNRLIALWKEKSRPLAGRNEHELIFFTFHGHWPQRACEKEDCGKSDRLK